ncbi:MAG: LytTR family DNA-binding domain-containing protein [Deferribacterota bacterium]|nr:LytTR family DNA-binding domain-containing protein [Deferribacterota bacterium]
MDNKRINLEHIEPGILIFSSKNYTILYINRIFLSQFHEFTKDEIFQNDIFHFHSSKIREKIKKMIYHINKTEEQLPFTLKKYDSLGRHKYLMIKLIKIYSKNDDYNYCLLTFDVSDILSDEEEKILNYIPILKNKEINLLSVDNIIFIKAENIYTRLFTADDNFLSEFTISSLEERLDTKKFFRVHRSYIINMHYIEKIIKDPHGLSINMKFYKNKIPISRSRKEEFKSFIGLK